MAWEVGSPDTGEEAWNVTPTPTKAVRIIVNGEEKMSFDEKPPAKEVIDKIMELARKAGLARITVYVNGIQALSPATFADLYEKAKPPIMIEIGKADYAGSCGGHTS